MVDYSKKINEILKFESNNIVSSWIILDMKRKAMKIKFEKDTGFVLHENLISSSLKNINTHYKEILDDIHNKFGSMDRYKAYMFYIHFRLLEGEIKKNKKNVIVLKENHKFYRIYRTNWLKYFYRVVSYALTFDFKDKDYVFKQLLWEQLKDKNLDIKTDLFIAKAKVERNIDIVFKTKEQAKDVMDLLNELKRLDDLYKWSSWDWGSRRIY